MEEIMIGLTEAIKEFVSAFENADRNGMEQIAPTIRKYYELLESKGYEKENIMNTAHEILLEVYGKC